MGTANFKTFDETGKELLNANLATYCFVKSGKLTRLISHTFESTLRVIGKKARRANTGHENVYGYIHTPHYCVYYIDLPLDSISPLPFVHHVSGTMTTETVVYLSTGKVGNSTRIFFYSNRRLSDDDLDNIHVFVFDIKPLKENKVGLNLYNQQGQLTFSSKTYPLSIKLETVHLSDKSSYIALEYFRTNWYGSWENSYVPYEHLSSPLERLLVGMIDTDFFYKKLVQQGYSISNYNGISKNITGIGKIATLPIPQLRKNIYVELNRNESNGTKYHQRGTINIDYVVLKGIGSTLYLDKVLEYREINSDGKGKYIQPFMPQDSISPFYKGLNGEIDIDETHLKFKYIDVTHLPFPFN